MARQSEKFAASKFAGCDVADWLSDWAKRCGLDSETEFAMRLCAEELVTNVVMHGLGGDPGGHSIEVMAEAEPDRARIVIVDDGIAFNSATAADPGRQGSIEQATIGGRGIRLIRAHAAGIEWERIADRNQTTLTFNVSRAPGR
jgi:serine/threonine-protein kinase RsbW